MYPTIDELRSQLGGTSTSAITPEYRAKMLHPLPTAPTVKREAFIVKHCAGKRVLEFGASGPLHDAIMAVASEYAGVDREPSRGVVAYDLDDCGLGDAAAPLGWTEEDGLLSIQPEIVICGEVLEHLSNPGWFLTRLKRQYCGVPLIVTVPNAFSKTGAHWVAKGIENVNVDHVAWYSPSTLRVLLERAGYTVGQLFYYNGAGPTAEGLIVCAE